MTDSRTQATYQVRLGWGSRALSALAMSGIVVVVDAIPSGSASGTQSGAQASIAADAAALSHGPAVFTGSLRNATATAKAAFDEQVARGGRTAINLVLVGDEGAFAVEDYLAAGAIADGLTSLGLDHSSPDVAVAAEGFRALKRALKHLLSASAAGLELAELGRRDEVKAAAELDAEAEASGYEP